MCNQDQLGGLRFVCVLFHRLITFSLNLHNHFPDNNGNNFTTVDKLYLLSTHEVWEDVDGNTNSGIDYYDSAYNNTRQLDYYAGLNVTTSNYSGAIKQYNGLNDDWWLRSAASSNPHCFCDVTTVRTWITDYASYGYGVAPAFRIA